jgi:hypothetical protein
MRSEGQIPLTSSKKKGGNKAMSLLYKILVEQRKKQRKNSRNIRTVRTRMLNGNEDKTYVCHACKSTVEAYETFWFLDKTYCVLCYVLLTS